MWYLYIAAVVGILFELARPAEHDNLSLFSKIAIPALAGLLWPVVLGFTIYHLIRTE